MIIVCIDNSEYEESLTINKSYECLNEFLPISIISVVIHNDNDLLSSYKASRFVALEKFREEQLKKLGI